ncbi:HYR domain-containing protein [Aquimarina sp. BL5]|uniref:leucine-rich repeat protein n=1 Tax=Aquimarina sp. BL5 TaxID=1714860 RepID=UPI000E4C9DBF|nr:leucine-rich repeat protein [Aquimarina sp. BL5]AXT52381.1 HYR domain-containing protein [Aquimarina sp. BL5]RKN10295.1 HYR domain-containing protein [Aquimarina sp. BL5]
MKTKLLMLIALLSAAVSFSQTFTIDNINYEVIDVNLNTVSAIGGSSLPSNLIIPETVTDPNTSISYTVTTIGREAFRNKGLASVILPQTLTTLEFRAFRDNSGITSITIPINVTSIGNESFLNNSLTEVISENSTPPSIARGTFGDRSQISLFVPTGTEVAYNDASWTGFSEVNGMLPVNSNFFVNNLNYRVTSSSPSTVEIIGGVVTDELIIPDSVVAPDGFSYTVTTIGGNAFRDKGLTDVTIPNSVTSIGNDAFFINQLTAVIIPNSVTSLGEGSFARNALTSITISTNVTALERAVFRNNNLSTFVIPNNITVIGNDVFRDNQLTSVIIPDSVISIGNSTFQGNQLTVIISEGISPATITSSSFENRSGINLFIPDNTFTSYENAGWTGFRSVSRITPSAVCQDITVQLDANGQVSIMGTDVDAESADNAGIESITVTPSNFDCSNIGNNEVTLTLTNVIGNTSSCTAIVTVEDGVPPVVQCRDITVQLDSNGEAFITIVDIEAESIDNCAIASKSINQDAFSTADVGENEVTFTAIDQNGNSASCIATVTVVANDFPVALCQDATVQLDATGLVTIAEGDIDAGSTDIIGIASITVTPNNFDCSNIGSNEVTLTITNTRGNSSSCIAIVTVEDTTAPAITCPADVVQDCGGIISYTLPTFSEDICGLIEVPTAVDGFGLLGTFENSTYFISNLPISGEQAFAEVQEKGYEIVTINNQKENDFIRSQVAPLGVSTVLIGYNDLTTEGVFEWQSGQPATFTNFNAGEPNDVGGEDMVVLISDTGLWNDISRENSRLYIIEFHNYDSREPIQVSGIPSGGFFTSGTTVNTFYIEDKAGNGITCSFNVTINDVTGPSLTCAEAITFESEPDICEANVSVPIPTFDDDCGRALVPDTFNVPYIFNTTTEELEDTPGILKNLSSSDTDVLLELTFSGDHNGLSESFVLLGPDSSIIFSGSGFGPVCVVVNEHITIPQSTWNSWITAFGSDLVFTLQNNSEVDNDQCDSSPNNFYRLRLPQFGDITLSNDFTGTSDATAIYPVGTTTVTWTAVDLSGNSTTCTQTITVNDTEIPNPVCQNITVRLDDTGQAIITAQDIDGGSTDNCAIDTVSVSQDTFTADNLGDNEVTLTVVDENGNEATCTAIVTVINDDFPIAICQDITVQLDENGSVNVTAQDVDGGSSDATGIDTLSISQSSFDCSNIGENTVTLTVTNTLGNSISCEAIVTVEDSILPIITCLVDITIPNETDLCEAEVTIPLLTDVIDNCGGSTIMPDTGIIPYLFDDDGDLIDTPSVLPGVTSATEDVLLQLNFSGDHDQSNENFTLLGPDSSVVFSDTGFNPVCVEINERITIPQDTWNDWVTIFGNDLSFTLQNNLEVDKNLCNSGSVNFFRLRLPQFGNVSVFNDYTRSADASGIYPVGTTEVTWSVEDTSGNIATCLQTIIVNSEGVAPEAICTDITVQLDENDTITITAADIDGGSVANCSIASLEVTPNTFGLTEIGENTVVLTVTDQSGNVATCNSIVTVVPNDFVVAACKDITISLDQNGQATITGEDVFGGNIDDTNTATFDVIPNSFDSSNIGANVVTLTVSNTDGSTSSCDAIVNVIDAAIPTVVCQDITVQLDANGQVVVSATEIDGGSSDVFGIGSLSIGSSVVEPATLPGLYALDRSSTNNLARYNYDPSTDAIAIVDNPYGETSLENTIHMDFNPIDGQVYLIADSPTTDNRALFLYDLETNTLGAELGDINAANGNPRANSMVFAPDGKLYVSFGNGAINVLNVNTMTTTALASAPKNGGGIGLGYDYDTDRLIYTSLNEDESLVDLYEIDTTNGDVTLLFSFVQGITGCGGTAQALEYVGNGKFVVSTTFGCSEIYTIDINAQVVAPVLSPDRFTGDIKSLLYISVNESSRPGSSITFDCADIGSNEVALTITDSNGNVASCFATITVEDIPAPQISCPVDQTVVSDEGSDTYSLPDYFASGEALATGTCANPLVTFTQNPIAGTLLDSGVTIVTLCAADAFGNEICCSFEITVDTTLSTEDLEQLGSISMYPNPASDVVHFSNPAGVVLNNISVYDMNGRLIISDQKSVSESDVSLDISRLESGSYFVIIEGKQGSITKQLIRK